MLIRKRPKLLREFEYEIGYKLTGYKEHGKRDRQMRAPADRSTLPRNRALAGRLVISTSLATVEDKSIPTSAVRPLFLLPL